MTDLKQEELPPLLGLEPPYVDASGETDAEKGAKLGGLGGVVTGAVAGAMVGPAGALLGAAIGGVVAAVASGVAVAVVDRADGDSPREELESAPVNVHISVAERMEAREQLAARDKERT